MLARCPLPVARFVGSMAMCMYVRSVARTWLIVVQFALLLVSFLALGSKVVCGVFRAIHMTLLYRATDMVVCARVHTSCQCMRRVARTCIGM